MSIIVPAYNAAPYIGATLESIVAQTFSDYELIVVNDGSPDTPALEMALAPYRGSLTYIFQENRGAAAARNAALRIARGTFVAFLDADDFWLPDYLEVQVAFLRAHPDVDVVYADARLTGDSPLAGRTFMETAPSRGPVTVESLLSLQCHVIASGVVARREPVLDVGMFDETIRRGHDFDLWIRLARRGVRFAYQKKVLLRRRIHLDSLSGDSVAEDERALAGLRRIERSLPLSDGERAALKKSAAWVEARLDLERAKLSFRNGDIAAASAAVARAHRACPRLKLRAILIALRVAPLLLRRIDQARMSRLEPAKTGGWLAASGLPWGW